MLALKVCILFVHSIAEHGSHSTYALAHMYGKCFATMLLTIGLEPITVEGTDFKSVVFTNFTK